MSGSTTAWIAFGAYLLITTGLALRGMRKTKGMESFALGNRDMGPLLVGITLAASIASTATFVINPGFVWKNGLSALLHFGVAGTSGVVVGLVVLSRGFRRLGESNGALTLPHWIGSCYGSKPMRMYFAALNLLLAIAFVVLIVKGSALVMQATLGLGYEVCVLVVVGFVFSYIMLGGTYAHAYTNALQGSIMLVVALALFGSGLAYLLGGEFFSSLASQDPTLVEVVRSTVPNEVNLYDTFLEVFVCGFIVSFGLVCQPHILMKSLYLKTEKDLNRYLVIAALVGFGFALVLLVGLYARVGFPELDVSQDAIVPAYIQSAFSPWAGALISVALLAAGMSTMDGILVSASTIAGNDLVLGLLGKGLDDEARQKLALRSSRIILVLMGVLSFIVALDPPVLVGLFAQAGIYGLVAASAAPVTFGVFLAGVPTAGAFAAAIVGPAVHFIGYLGLGVENPALSATAGVVASTMVLGVATIVKLNGPERDGETQVAWRSSLGVMEA